jgi:hypothetical protein
MIAGTDKNDEQSDLLAGHKLSAKVKLFIDSI